MKRTWFALPLVALLSACGGDGTTVSINGNEGEFAAKADKDGTVSVKAPGFEGKVKLPKFQLGAEEFDIDGVKLYPGSTIADLNVTSREGADGAVKVVFNAPATATRVQEWFREQMQTAGFTVMVADGALSGKTGEGNPFTLKIAPDGEAKSKGTLSVTGS